MLGSGECVVFVTGSPGNGGNPGKLGRDIAAVCSDGGRGNGCHSLIRRGDGISDVAKLGKGGKLAVIILRKK